MKIEINQEYYKCDYCETTHEDYSLMLAYMNSPFSGNTTIDICGEECMIKHKELVTESWNNDDDFSSMYKWEGYDLERFFEHEIKYN